MIPRATALALLTSFVLAVLVVSATPPSGDTASAAWPVSPGFGGVFLATDPSNGSVWTERFDPILGLASKAIPDAGIAFGLHRVLGVALLLFFLTRIAAALGASPAFCLAAAALFALLLPPVGRTLPTLWTVSPWPAALAWALLRLPEGVSPLRFAAAAGAIVALALGSEPWFHLALLPLALWALAAGPRCPRTAIALAAITTGLWIATGGDPPAPGPVIEEIPVVRGFRPVAAGATPAETAGALLLALAGGVAFLADPRVRRPLLVAAILTWASFGLHVPTALRWLAPFHLFPWVPSGDEYHAPALLLPVVTALTALSAARAGSSRLPAGFAAAVAAAGVAGLVAVVVLAPPRSSTLCRFPLAPVPSVLAWPPDAAALSDCLARRTGGSRYANLDDARIPELAPFLARRPDPFWSEDFWSWARDAGVTHVHGVAGDVRPLPAGAAAATETPDLLEIAPARALRRYGRLRRLPPDRWAAHSDGASPDVLPEAAAFDGDLDTRWGTGRPQRPGQHFELDLGSEVPGVTRLVLDTGPWESDGPRRLRVSAVAEDGTTTLLADDSRPEAPRLAVEFPPTPLRRLRLEQRGVTVVFDWSIAELEVWVDPRRGEPGPSAAGSTDRAPLQNPFPGRRRARATR